MKTENSETIERARQYYNSADAHSFYTTIWGGEDHHLGLYKSDHESIYDASRRIVDHMASKLTNLASDSKLIDVGAGFGGSARHVARQFGCDVTCLNLSEVENKRNRKMSAEQGLDDRITVVDGNFEEVPLEDSQFDCVWSQDAILHSGERGRVLSEMKRLLKKGGEAVFTDIMQADECPPETIEPILARIHLQSLGSPDFYIETAGELGFEVVEHEDLTPHLITHYSRVLEETEKHEAELKSSVSQEYLENMKTGLKHWINGGRNGHLAWGLFHLRLPS